MFTFDGTMSHLSTMLYLGATPGSVAPTRIAQPQPGLISIGFSSLGLEPLFLLSMSEPSMTLANVLAQHGFQKELYEIIKLRSHLF